MFLSDMYFSVKHWFYLMLEYLKHATIIECPKVWFVAMFRSNKARGDIEQVLSWFEIHVHYVKHSQIEMPLSPNIQIHLQQFKRHMRLQDVSFPTPPYKLHPNIRARNDKSLEIHCANQRTANSMIGSYRL